MCSKTGVAKPEGFVRFISINGNVYEGGAKDGFYDEWGRLTYKNSTAMGYWKLKFPKYGSSMCGYNRRFCNNKIIKEGYVEGLHY